MPIVPRDAIPEPMVPQHVPAMPVMPVNRAVPEMLAQVSKIGLEVAAGLTHVQVRAQRAEDATELAKRTMIAENDIDTTLDAIRTTREVHKTAPDEYTQTINQLSQKWTKDLRPDLSAHLTKTLTPRIIEGLRTTREIRNASMIDDAKTTADEVERDMIDRAGRLDVTDEQAFGRVKGPAVSWPDSEFGAAGETPTPGAYPTYLKELVTSNLMKAETAQKRYTETLDAMAYRRLQRMSISDNPGLVQGALDILTKEEDQKGSTFASYLSAEHRNALIQAAQGQRETLRHRANEDWDRADRLSRQNQRDLDDEQKRQDNGEITQFTLGIFRGERGMADLNKILLYNRTLRDDTAKVEHLRGLIEKSSEAGGTTNWSLYNQVWREIQTSRGALNVTDRVLPLIGKTGGISRADAERLIAAGRTAGESSVFKDDFYQAGQRDLDRALLPAVGVVDEGKQRRYAEASREFYDRAAPLVQAGQREKIPNLAREISDRYIAQAPNVTAIAPRVVPRYPDVESTVQGFIAQYGPPVTWSPAVTQEFNRQVYQHKQMAPPPGAPGVAPKPKSVSKFPNPIAQ